MSRDYAHEDWIPWYVSDTAGWLELSLAARGAAEGIARKMGRGREELPLGSRGLRGLARTLGCTWEELEPALRELLAPGPNGEPPRLVHDEERGVLRDPQAVERRRPTSTSRVRKLREKAANDSAPASLPPPPDETHVTVSSVSKPHETGVSVPSILISSDLKDQIPEEIPSARARDPEPAPSPPPKATTPAVTADPDNPEPDWWAGVLETIGAGTGEDLPARESWLRYAGHRASKARPAERRDAVHWLTTVMVREAREAREKARQQRDRDAKWDKARAGPAAPSEPPTQAEAKANAERLAQRIAARKAREKGAA